LARDAHEYKILLILLAVQDFPPYLLHYDTFFQPAVPDFIFLKLLRDDVVNSFS